ncbi:hypothetical protein ACJA88_012914 [Fusarium oxysporum]
MHRNNPRTILTAQLRSSTTSIHACMERIRLPIQRFNEWAPKLDDIKIDIQNVAQESNDKEPSRALDAVYIPVDIATNLQQENQQLKQAISCEFDDPRLLQITTESEALPSHPENPSLWTRMTKLQEPRKDIWAKVSGQFCQDLSKITYSVCYASTQVEDLAREAKTFDKPMLRRLQKKQGVKQLWKYLMAKSVTTEEELDNYEAELTMIGRSAIDMLDGGFVLP